MSLAYSLSCRRNTWLLGLRTKEQLGATCAIPPPSLQHLSDLNSHAHAVSSTSRLWNAENKTRGLRELAHLHIRSPRNASLCILALTAATVNAVNAHPHLSAHRHQCSVLLGTCAPEGRYPRILHCQALWRAILGILLTDVGQGCVQNFLRQPRLCASTFACLWLGASLCQSL